MGVDGATPTLMAWQDRSRRDRKPVGRVPESLHGEIRGEIEMSCEIEPGQTAPKRGRNAEMVNQEEEEETEGNATRPTEVRPLSRSAPCACTQPAREPCAEALS